METTKEIRGTFIVISHNSTSFWNTNVYTLHGCIDFQSFYYTDLVKSCHEDCFVSISVVLFTPTPSPSLPFISPADTACDSGIDNVRDFEGFKGKTQNHALYMAVHSLGYSVFIYLSLVTNTSYKHIQTIFQRS